MIDSRFSSSRLKRWLSCVDRLREMNEARFEACRAVAAIAALDHVLRESVRRHRPASRRRPTRMTAGSFPTVSRGWYRFLPGHDAGPEPMPAPVWTGGGLAIRRDDAWRLRFGAFRRWTSIVAPLAPPRPPPGRVVHASRSGRMPRHARPARTTDPLVPGDARPGRLPAHRAADGHGELDHPAAERVRDSACGLSGASEGHVHLHGNRDRRDGRVVGRRQRDVLAVPAAWAPVADALRSLRADHARKDRARRGMGGSLRH